MHARDTPLFTCGVRTLLEKKPLKLLKSINLADIRPSIFCVVPYNGKSSSTF